jgi:hypothetical protein
MSKFLWKTPIFILGNPRSGTSLLRLMLDSHSSICIPPESHFFLWLEEKYGKWEYRFLDNYLDDLLKATKFETWQLEKNEIKNFLINYTIKSYSHLTSLIYYFYALKHHRDISFWGDKNSLWVDKLHKIKEHYPKAFFIHIVRDGRDIACSYKSLNSRKLTSKYAPKLPNDISEIADTWIKNNQHIEHFLNAFDSEQTVQINYENLLMSPKDTLQKVLDKLDLKFLDSQIQYYLKDKKDIEPEAFFEWKEKLTQPPDYTNVGKYKEQLTPEDINVFNTLAKNTLLKYGYL